MTIVLKVLEVSIDLLHGQPHPNTSTDSGSIPFSTF